MPASLEHQERVLAHLEGQMSKPRVTADATTDLEASQRWCTCCKKPLAGKFAWLELDQRTDTYHDHGDVPVDNSQGWFPFGMTCARNELAKARAT